MYVCASCARRSQWVDRRCLSFREARSSASARELAKGEDAEAAIGSSGTRGAGQDCAALLCERDMMAICAASVARGSGE